MDKVLITGGKGNLARELVATAKNKDVFAPDRSQMDITKLCSLNNILDDFSPDYLIHAAAYTRPMNKHHINPSLSIKTNIIGTSNIVLSCLDKDIKLIYISTDYVYPGIEGNFSEGDPLYPYSNCNDGVAKYGWSKLGGECAVQFLDNSLILRACICEYPFPHPKAFIDVRKSLMYIKDAAPIIWQLIDYEGIINLGGLSQSVYDFVKEDQKDILPISSQDIHDVKIAPNSTMDTSKLQGILKNKNKVK